MHYSLILSGLLLGALAIDGLAVPRSGRALRFRSASGTAILLLVVASGFGAFLALIGNPAGAAALALVLLALVIFASNAKARVLGEPLVFTDLGLIGAIFRHPQFYVDALALWQKLIVAAALLALPAVAVTLFRADLEAHLGGLFLMAVALLILRLTVSRLVERETVRGPNLAADVARHGLVPVLLLYWYAWRQSADPAPVPVLDYQPQENEVLVIVQCESFADPRELFGAVAPPLAGLERARARAILSGNLLVDGFGAYTMRTEFGVLFGRHEPELGFRKFDPYLTALGEHSHALPARLGAAWHRVFVHPHDLRFYGRDQVMPAAGFERLVGPEEFAEPEGQYVPDVDIAEAIRAVIDTRPGPVMLVAVTIENHGPWQAESSDPVPAGYIDLVRKGDAMLEQLLDLLEQSGRPATLVFYGDHRPSIPGAVEPGQERHTPYVVVRLGYRQDQLPASPVRADLTPAGLHHAILHVLTAGQAVPPAAEQAPEGLVATAGRTA